MIETLFKSVTLLLSGWLLIETIRLPDGLYDTLLFIGRKATGNSRRIGIDRAINILRVIIVIACLLACSYAGRGILF